MRIVPSIGMMHAFLDAQYSEPVEIKPRLHLSTEMQIRDSGPHSRDMMMSFPGYSGGNKCPSKADGFPAPWYDFSYHDFYHAITASAVPREYRKAGVVTYDALSELAKNQKSEKGIQQLAISLMDMEYIKFQHFLSKNSHPADFWSNIDEHLFLQQHKFKIQEESRLLGKSVPYEVFPIAAEEQVTVFKHLFHIFVSQNKGPAELTEASFKAFIHSKREALEKEVEQVTRRAVKRARKNMQLELRFDPGPPPKHQVEEARTIFRSQLENQPLLIAAKELGF